MKKLILVIAVIATFTSCKKEEITPVEPSNYQYEVSGSAGKYDITCEGAPNGTVQYSNVGNGWWYKWTQTGTRWLYMSAQNQTGYGTVTVKIIKDGKVIAQQTSSGAYVIASISGTY